VFVLVASAAKPARPLGAAVATKGFRAAWGSINVRLFIPLAFISGNTLVRWGDRKIVPDPVGFFSPRNTPKTYSKWHTMS
jgi:hypothetical protein